MDSACYNECVISRYYDSLIAKVVVQGRNREEAISRMRRALEMFIIEGVHTLIPLHQKILSDVDFNQGNYNVSFLERFQTTPNKAEKKAQKQPQVASTLHEP